MGEMLAAFSEHGHRDRDCRHADDVVVAFDRGYPTTYLTFQFKVKSDEHRHLP
jgi:hypothetical protein